MRSKMHSKLFLLVAVLTGSLALAGCWEDFDVVLHEPGIYKGPNDPLLSDGSPAALIERFSQGQTDR